MSHLDRSSRVIASIKHVFFAFFDDEMWILIVLWKIILLGFDTKMTVRLLYFFWKKVGFLMFFSV